MKYLIYPNISLSVTKLSCPGLHSFSNFTLTSKALSIPVLANGNIRDLRDVHECMTYTGCDGVLSAESLLVDPALFSPSRLLPEVGGDVNSSSKSSFQNSNKQGGIPVVSGS